MPKEAREARHDKPHYIREWRRSRRGMTIDRLAELSGYSASHISRVERNEDSYSQEFLEAIARALDCGVRDLFWNPELPSWQELSDLILTMTDDQREQAVKILSVLAAQKKSA